MRETHDGPAREKRFEVFLGVRDEAGGVIVTALTKCQPTHEYQPTNRRGQHTRLTRRPNSRATVRKRATQRYCKKSNEDPAFFCCQQDSHINDPKLSDSGPGTRV